MKKNYKKKSIISGILSTMILFVILIIGRVSSLKEIIGAILISLIYGIILGYSVDVLVKNSIRKFSKYIWSFLIILTFGVLIISFMKPSILWDTWQVYDMSKYVFSDFGYMTQIRQQILNTHYEMAFPPVFPILISIVNMIYNLGVNAAVLLNSIFILLSFVELSKIFKEKNVEVAGAITTFIIFGGKLFISTYAGGLSQSLGYYLLILLVRIILSEQKYKPTFAIKTALCAGIMLMNRFDALAIVVVMFFLIPFLMYKEHNWKFICKNMLIYVFTVVLVCSPWIFYSFVHFGTPFITDNGRRLFNIPDTRPSTFFPYDNPAPTIMDSFTEWLSSFTLRAYSAIISLVKVIIYNSIIIEVLVLLIVLLRKYTKGNRKILYDNRVVGVILIILGQEALFIFTGYKVLRYHLPILFLLQFGVIYIVAKLNKIKNSRKNIIIMTLLFILIYGKVGFITNPVKVVNSFINENGYTSNLVLNEDEQRLYSYLEDDCKTICFYRGEKTLDFLKFSAESEISNIISPNNLSVDNVVQFVETFDVNYLYSYNKTVVDIFGSKFKLVNTPFENLYKLGVRK